MIWGRLIGLFIGARLLGFWGGVLGFWLGSLLDYRLGQRRSPIDKTMNIASQQAFFESAFLVMGYLAKIDGPIQTAEIRAAEAAMARFAVDANIKREAVDLFREGSHPDFDLEPVLARFELELAPYENLRHSFIAIQLKVALADGPLHPAEKAFLLELCKRLRIHSQHFSALGKDYERPRYSHEPLMDAYRVLGLSSSASDAEIKQHYRRLMNQHHPDKILARGLPQSYLRQAQEKTQAIRAAYDEIRAQRALG